MKHMCCAEKDCSIPQSSRGQLRGHLGSHSCIWRRPARLHILLDVLESMPNVIDSVAQMARSWRPEPIELSYDSGRELLAPRDTLFIMIGMLSNTSRMHDK
jgi:hypothetical protein